MRVKKLEEIARDIREMLIQHGNEIRKGNEVILPSQKTIERELVIYLNDTLERDEVVMMLDNWTKPSVKTKEGKLQNSVLQGFKSYLLNYRSEQKSD